MTINNIESLVRLATHRNSSENAVTSPHPIAYHIRAIKYSSQRSRWKGCPQVHRRASSDQTSSQPIFWNITASIRLEVGSNETVKDALNLVPASALPEHVALSGTYLWKLIHSNILTPGQGSFMRCQNFYIISVLYAISTALLQQR